MTTDITLNNNIDKFEYTNSYQYSGLTITLFTGSKVTEKGAAQIMNRARRPYNPLLIIT